VAELFDRRARLNVGGLLVRAGDDTGLDLTFRVEKTLQKEPNTAEIQVLGLNADHRTQLGEKERVPVELEAGYVDTMALIFRGDLRNVHSTPPPPAWVTKLESGDGGKAVKAQRVQQSFKGRVQLFTVLQAAANAMGVGIGNATAKAAKGKWIDGGKEWNSATTLSGPVSKELTRVLQAAGMEWSILDGNLQLLEQGKGLNASAVLLSPDTGLIASPSIETRDKGKRVVQAKALLNPQLQPGRLVTIESRSVNATVRIDRSVFTGETRGQSWYVDVEGTLS